MWAMFVKEFRQLRRDRRTMAMMIVMPVLLLVVLGYAASFDVSSVPVAAAGPRAAAVAGLLPRPFDVVSTDAAAGQGWARDQLRDGHAAVAAVTALARLRGEGAALAGAAGGSAPAGAGAGSAAGPEVTILYNPHLTTSYIMIPGLAGVVLVFIGTIITSLGVVR